MYHFKHLSYCQVQCAVIKKRHCHTDNIKFESHHLAVNKKIYVTLNQCYFLCIKALLKCYVFHQRQIWKICIIPHPTGLITFYSLRDTKVNCCHMVMVILLKVQQQAFIAFKAFFILYWLLLMFLAIWDNKQWCSYSLGRITLDQCNIHWPNSVSCSICLETPLKETTWYFHSYYIQATCNPLL